MKGDCTDNRISYRLIELSEEHVKTLHHWQCEESRPDLFTCRPVKPAMTLIEYQTVLMKAVSELSQYVFLLIEDGHDELLGKIVLFDINRRNHSAEFGYYLPEKNRQKGLGTIMAGLFLELVFKDSELDLNKICATTSSFNLPSCRLLEKYGFRVDGRLREHYWIDDSRYDQLNYSLFRKEYQDFLEMNK